MKNISTFFKVTKSLFFNYKSSKIFLIVLLVLFGFCTNLYSQILQRGVAITATSNNATTLTINKPTGVGAGDLMIVNVTSTDNNNGLGDATLAGWIEIDGNNLGGNNYDRRITILYKVAGFTEPTSYIFAINGNGNIDRNVGAIIAFSGVDATNPFDVAPGILNSRDAATVIAISLSTVTNNAAILMLGGSRGNGTWSAWNTITSPGILTELYDVQNNNPSIGAAWAIKATAGSTGNGSATTSNDRNSSILLALRPAKPPTITGLSSASGCPGSSLVISGTNLTGTTAVTIGGVAVSSFTVNSATQITAIIAAAASGAAGVTVTTPGGTTASFPFIVNVVPSITLTSAVGTNSQSRCINTTITDITYSIVGAGATSASVTGLPAGVTGGYNAGIFTISGSPTVTGVFTYTVTTTGGTCASTTTGTLAVSALPTITLTSAPATVNQSICRGGAVTNITYLIGVGVTGVIPTGLPAGVTGNLVGSNYTLSGTPTVNGPFSYTLTTTGGACSAATINGGITVNALPANPGNPTSNSPQCNPPGVTLTPTGTVPTGETWYWQTTAGGTTTTNSNATYVVNTSGTYYIRAQNNSTGCWSSGSGSLPVIVTPSVTGIPGTPNPANASIGVCYSGTGAITIISWGAVANATSYEVYFGAGSLPGTVTATVTTNSYPGLTLLPNTTYYWRVVAKDDCFNAVSSVIFTFTTATIPCYCTPSVSTNSQAQTNYIYQVNFLGTLLDTFNASTYSTNPLGYQDFTGIALKSVQADGNGMNIYMASRISGYYKAWVDWNKDGIFNNAEVVYNSSGIAQASTTVGVVIPAGTPPGDYRMRLRVNGQIIGNNISGDSNASPCGNLNYPGETEDYLFTVISNCSANIQTAPRTYRCGTGSVKLEPTASSGVAEFRWYSSETGGSPIATTAATGNTTSWDTPSISATTIYYVTAFNGCESLIRTPMVAVINTLPLISFSPSSAEVCGNDVLITVSATGSNQIEYLINENFTGGLNGFTNQLLSGSNGTNAAAAWQVRSSIFKPALFSWYPVISSGVNGNRFIMATSDVGVSGLITENALVLPVKSTTNFVNLTLNFKMYYSRYYPDGTNLNADFVNVEVATNVAGNNWVLIPGVQPNPSRITTDVGIGTKFTQLSYNLTNYINQPNLRIRIRYHGEWCDGVAVDDVELFGEKPLTPSFSWTSNNPIAFYSDAAATTLYTGTPASVVYVKPTSAQLEMYENWQVSATATLSNGCSASGIVTVDNNNKVWNAASSSWNNSDWYPGGTGLPPTANNCVFIKQPVVLGAGVEGFAKNVKIEVGGKLTINPNQTLTVTDEFINQGVAGDVLIESDGNLIQINEGPAINTGDITAKRNVILSTGRQQYNYLISPLEGQSLASIYKDASGNVVAVPYVLYHNEVNGKFYTSSGAYIKGRGLAVKEPATGFAPTTMGATFSGKPTNGAFTYTIVNSNPADAFNRGFNLIGNPYPSNIDLEKLYSSNGAVMDATVYFWDNKANGQTVQLGDSYLGQAYATYNIINGTGIHATGDPSLTGTKVPTKYVKTGQGFMVKSKVSSGVLNFNNTIRTKFAGPDFFGKNAEQNEVPKNRYWLNMISPANIVANMAVVYFAEGNNGFSQDDSRSMGGSDVVYSIVESENVSINGRSTFVETDLISLGTQYFTAGNYTIALGEKEGIFNQAQNIYLQDKQTGTVTNLSEGNYTFVANEGVSTGRFEIFYRPESVLVTSTKVKEGIIVYLDQDYFIIKSPKTMSVIQVYDASGKLMTVLKPNGKKGILNISGIANGMYVLRITTIDGEVTNKKISR